uniref:DUF4524 domain-containing protein n=1 Tax=Bursaphelenchus xylophilus TaxID=6326 RepID=A0A1I7SFJ2_BURXY
MDTASTFAAITRVLLMCGPMFEQPRPTDVFITTYGINENGKLTRFFHDETTGEISSSLISSLTEYDLKSASFQFLIHDEDLSIKGQVELADGMRCPVAGTAMEPGILNKDRCKQLVRFIASNEHVYEIPCTPELSSVESDASGKAAAGDAKVEIRTLTCDDHIALTVGGTEVVLRKNGRCRMIRFAEFTQRWRLNKCEVEKLKVPADNEKHGPFSMTDFDKIWHFSWWIGKRSKRTPRSTTVGDLIQWQKRTVLLPGTIKNVAKCFPFQVKKLRFQKRTCSLYEGNGALHCPATVKDLIQWQKTYHQKNVAKCLSFK